MTTTTTNEAAERLRSYLNRAEMHDGPYGPVVRTVDVLDEALAAAQASEYQVGYKAGVADGRRATVERIRELLVGQYDRVDHERIEAVLRTVAAE